MQRTFQRRRRDDRELRFGEELPEENRRHERRIAAGRERIQIAERRSGFHGEKRTNETHASRTDPEAKLHRKVPGKKATLCHMGHAVGENRNGLIEAITVTEASGTAERSAAVSMLDSGEFLRELESRGDVPHVPLVKEPCDPESAKPSNRKPGIEARHRMKVRMTSDGYRLSQKCRKKIEEVFGWLKTIAGLGRSRVVGRWKLLEVGAAAFNLVRLRSLKPA